MKKYDIEVIIDEETVEDMIEDWKCYFDTKKELKEYVKLYNELKGVHSIITFEEYDNLLIKVRDFCGGDYKIYNNGTYISIYD